MPDWTKIGYTLRYRWGALALWVVFTVGGLLCLALLMTR